MAVGYTDRMSEEAPRAAGAPSPTRPPIFTRRALIAGGAAVGIAAFALALLGRRLWCKQGDLSPWSWEVASAHNSQHLVDPYIFTHVLHGVMFFFIIWAFARDRLAPDLRLIAAIVAEAAWEVLENTNAVIEKYREATISLDYFGDSILNSVADIAACAGGYAIAATVPAVASAGMFVVFEVGLLAWIKDSLLLNILMLVWPADTWPVSALKQWQLGG